jgi:hypothetical protein
MVVSNSALCSTIQLCFVSLGHSVTRHSVNHSEPLGHSITQFVLSITGSLGHSVTEPNHSATQKLNPITRPLSNWTQSLGSHPITRPLNHMVTSICYETITSQWIVPGTLELCIFPLIPEKGSSSTIWENGNFLQIASLIRNWQTHTVNHRRSRATNLQSSNL